MVVTGSLSRADLQQMGAGRLVLNRDIRMIQKWDIQAAAGQCAGTGRKLEPGEEYYAALVDKKTCFERLDYSVEYWNAHKPEVFSFWKTTVAAVNEKKNLFVDDSVLTNFFERLESEQESVKINFRFVLALILMRKRILKYEQTKRNGDREVWRVRQTGSKETHDVINPQLSEEEIEQVSAQLGSILRG